MNANTTNMIQFESTIGNKIGLHLRAAGEFVKIASQFESEITVYNGERSANGKSILSLAGLAAACGTVITVQIDGDDEHSARSALETLLEKKFYEE